MTAKAAAMHTDVETATRDGGSVHPRLVMSRRSMIVASSAGFVSLLSVSACGGASEERAMQTTGELEYQVRGDGDPILFIHGAFDEAALVPVRDALEGYRRVLYHRRGYGGSAPHREGLTFEQEAADALDVLRHAGLASAHVVGHSSGGVVAFQLAVSSPAAVRSLVLLEPPLQLPPTDPPAAPPPFLTRAFDLYGAGDPEAATDAFYQGISGPGWRKVLTSADPSALDRITRHARIFFELEAKAVLAYPFTEQSAKAVTQPVLFVVSDRGADRSAMLRAQFKSWMPQTRQLLVKDADHLLSLQQPSQIAEGIRGFLSAGR
jgi:pimeloyl-ACP methyl ester carboxylesterase